MKKFNYKSRKGFTLIELLVVIGILAVLAAIAIPSVAGLIDRANVSADDTNANEMTNALERFTSEYELFCQDIASGRFNPDDLDSAQSRVYNVTGADSRDDITQLESELGLIGKKINKDTKYPENIATIKSVVENYTKTSSATFEPKQSDMHFYYSPECGVVIFGEASETMDEDLILALNKKIVSGKNAKGQELNETTEWINLTLGSSVLSELNNNENYIHGNIIPEGATYQIKGGELLVAGELFPETIKDGDEYTFGDYIYKYNYFYRTDNENWHYAYPNGNFEPYRNYWGVMVKNRTQTSYGKVLETINGKDIVRYTGLFQSCTNLTSLKDDFRFSNKVIEADKMFYNCTSLTSIPTNLLLGQSVQNISEMFSNCTSLETIPSTFVMPNSVIDANSLFYDCTNLSQIPNYFRIGNSVKDISAMFCNCQSLKEIPSTLKIPNSVEYMNGMFSLCYLIDTIPSTFKIGPNVIECSDLFMDCSIKSIPSTFTIPENVEVTSFMFYNCKELSVVPENFTLPKKTQYVSQMFYGCKSLGKIPESIIIHEDMVDFSGIFADCGTLTGTLVINCEAEDQIYNTYEAIFAGTYGTLTLTGTSNSLQKIKTSSGCYGTVIIQ